MASNPGLIGRFILEDGTHLVLEETIAFYSLLINFIDGGAQAYRMMKNESNTENKVFSVSSYMIYSSFGTQIHDESATNHLTSKLYDDFIAHLKNIEEKSESLSKFLDYIDDQPLTKRAFKKAQPKQEWSF